LHPIPYRLDYFFFEKQTLEVMVVEVCYKLVAVNFQGLSKMSLFCPYLDDILVGYTAF
jgi:hypothetical protein